MRGNLQQALSWYQDIWPGNRLSDRPGPVATLQGMVVALFSTAANFAGDGA